jgi:hypothetical protein
MTRAAWALLFVWAPTASACGKQCDEYAAAALTVRVVGSAGLRVCDAEVIALDGDESLCLESLGGSDCSYAGAWERSGTYVVRATFKNKEAISKPVRVTSGDCHVNGQIVDLTLAA